VNGTVRRVNDLPWGRQPFRTVHDATRLAIDHAVCHRPSGRQMRVLAAVISACTTWSRLVDERSLMQIAELAGFPASADPRDLEKRVAADLRALQKWGAVIYIPGTARGHPSIVGLPLARKAGSKSAL
jgi:hypothetical protein